MPRPGSILTIFILLSCPLGPVAIASNPQPPDGPRPMIRGQRLPDAPAHTFRDFVPGEAYEDDAAPLPGDFVNIMPSDDGSRVANPSGGPGSFLSYDVATKQVSRVALPQVIEDAMSGGSWRGPDGGPATAIRRSFGSMSAVTDFKTFPARANCSLRITYTDDDGNPLAATCSGILIDARIVLTAGHCVFIHDDDSTPEAHGWADSITVTAGTQNGQRPWGSAKSVNLISNEGWTDDEDYEWDIGFIVLDRPIGMLTGWADFTYNVDCDWIDERAFSQFSYPGEDCDGGGPLHTGTTMMSWSGQFDNCEWSGWELDNDNGEGCFDRIWQGMSGSVAITNVNGLWTATAVNSHLDTFWDTSDYIRLWLSVGQLARYTLIPDSRGTQFDLQPLKLRAGDMSEATAGQVITDATFHTCNPTDGFNTGQWFYTVRLSSDQVIDASDPLLHEYTYPADYPAMHFEEVACDPITIPYSVPSGSYFLGVMMHPFTDFNASNNSTDGWDALPISITGGHEIEPLSLSVVDPQVVRGHAIDFNLSLVNNGGHTAFNCPIVFRLSPDPIVDDTDPSIGLQVISTFGPGDTVHMGGSTLIPSGTSPGQYWLGATSSAYSELNTDNDTIVMNTPLQVFDTVDADTCDQALSITPGLTAFVTGGASTDGADHSECWWPGPYNDIWYRYQPTSAPYRIRLTTCEQLGGNADFDTSITVYLDGCPATTPIGCNDDDWDNACGTFGGGYHSTVTLERDDLTPLIIRLGGHTESIVGSGDMLLQLWSINDHCEDAIDLELGLTPFDTTLATSSGPPHEQCQFDGHLGSDIWYRFVAPRSGLVTMTTCSEFGGSASYDTDLAVYSGSCDDLVLLDCNDDALAYNCGYWPYYQSLVQTIVIEGDVLLVRVGGYGSGDVGTGELNVTIRPINDECVDAIEFTPGGLIHFDNTDAGSSGPDHPTCASATDNGETWHDLWYSFVAPQSGMFWAQTCYSVAHDTDLVLYHGTCELPFIIACNDDGCDNLGGVISGQASLLEGQVEQGVSYLFRVGSSQGSQPWDVGEGNVYTGIIIRTGDANGDGTVDVMDLLVVLDNFGGNGPAGDINQDGVVDIEDVLLVISNWG